VAVLNDWFAVLCAGIVGVTLNLILPGDSEEQMEILTHGDRGLEEQRKIESSME